MLVLPGSPYSHRVPIAIQMLHIDMLLKLGTKEELEKLNNCCYRGTIVTKIAMKQMQMSGTKSIIEEMNSTVKLTKNVTIHPYDTFQTSGIMKTPNRQQKNKYHNQASPNRKGERWDLYSSLL